MKRQRNASKKKITEPQNLKVIKASDSASNGMDGLIHERTRLGIVCMLAANGKTSFSDLKNHLEISDGNLSVHGRKLEEAGYIRISKSFSGRIPRTEYEITETGRRALRNYLDHMERLIDAMKEPHRNNDQ